MERKPVDNIAPIITSVEQVKEDLANFHPHVELVNGHLNLTGMFWTGGNGYTIQGLPSAVT